MGLLALLFSQLLDEVVANRLEESRQELVRLGEAGPAHLSQLVGVADVDVRALGWLAGQIDHQPASLGMHSTADLEISCPHEKTSLFLDLSHCGVNLALARLDLTSNEGPWRLAVMTAPQQNAKGEK